MAYTRKNTKTTTTTPKTVIQETGNVVSEEKTKKQNETNLEIIETGYKNLIEYEQSSKRLDQYEYDRTTELRTWVNEYIHNFTYTYKYKVGFHTDFLSNTVSLEKYLLIFKFSNSDKYKLTISIMNENIYKVAYSEKEATDKITALNLKVCDVVLDVSKENKKKTTVSIKPNTKDIDPTSLQILMKVIGKKLQSMNLNFEKVEDLDQLLILMGLTLSLENEEVRDDLFKGKVKTNKKMISTHEIIANATVRLALKCLAKKHFNYLIESLIPAYKAILAMEKQKAITELNFNGIPKEAVSLINDVIVNDKLEASCKS